jgi:carbon-monoxide dehydrogenase medium subunit
VKPAPFDYLAPDSLDAALAAMRQHGYDAKLLAGGQSLIPLLNFRLASPTVLVDLNRLAELDFVRPTGSGGLSIGAMTRQSRLGTEPLIGERAPLLREAVPFIAHPQIRSRGTFGGTLAHADPAAELPVVALALDARLRLRSDSGERWVAARDFFVGLLTTALEPHEILVEIEIPPPPPRCGWSFHEIARRHGDYALAGLTAQIVLDREGRCSAARLVYLSAGDGPLDATAAVEPLLGQRPDDSLLREVSRLAATEEVEPTGDIHASAEFKRHLCRVLTQRALATAFKRAQDG